MILAEGGAKSFPADLGQDSSVVLFPAGLDQHWNRGHSVFVPYSVP